MIFTLVIEDHFAAHPADRELVYEDYCEPFMLEASV